MTIMSGMTALLITGIGHWIIPVLSVLAFGPILLTVCFRRHAAIIRGYLIDEKGKRFALHAENLVGSGKKTDVQLKTVTEPRFGFIKVTNDGIITLIPYKGEFTVNGRTRDGTFVPKKGDRICAGKDILVYEPAKVKSVSVPTVSIISLLCALLVELVVIAIGVIALRFFSGEHFWKCFYAFLTLALLCPLYCILRIVRKIAIQPSVLAAFMLSSFSLAVTAVYTPGSILLQSTCVLIGLVLHLVLEAVICHGKLLPYLRYGSVIVAIILLALNLLNATSLLGARNWLDIWGINFQPSEMVKISIVLCGAATLKSSVQRTDKLFFMAFSAICVLCMAVISDFGTAMVFFFAYLVMMWIRSGWGDVIMSAAAAASGCGLIAIVKKDTVAYAVSRVLNWGSAWDNVLTSGYQQTRAMMAVASGGLFGVGLGKGWLSEIFAAGSDMPFAVLWEEHGFICAAVAVLSVALIVYDAVGSAVFVSNCFYAIASCGAAAIFVAQLALNVCGTMDMLPFTGITFPFLSTGGTSIVACWMLLSFITAANELSRPAPAYGGLSER